MPFNHMQMIGKKLVFKNWDWLSKLEVKIVRSPINWLNTNEYDYMYVLL